MSHVAAFAQWTGYVTWLLLAWALIGKTADIIWRFTGYRRRHRNARRLATWRPRHMRDPGHEVTRVLPGIQRPKGP